MQIVIEIPEEVYEKQRYSQYFGAWSVVLQKCFENGTPLPKGHGRLVDADALDISGKFNGVCLSAKPLWIAENIIRCASTIIEADKGDKE